MARKTAASEKELALASFYESLEEALRTDLATIARAVDVQTSATPLVKYGGCERSLRTSQHDSTSSTELSKSNSKVDTFSSIVSTLKYALSVNFLARHYR